MVQQQEGYGLCPVWNSCSDIWLFWILLRPNSFLHVTSDQQKHIRNTWRPVELHCAQTHQQGGVPAPSCWVFGSRCRTGRWQNPGSRSAHGAGRHAAAGAAAGNLQQTEEMWAGTVLQSVGPSNTSEEHLICNLRMFTGRNLVLYSSTQMMTFCTLTDVFMIDSNNMFL